MPGLDHLARERLASQLKVRAHELGFDACGISRAQRLDKEAEDLEQWLAQGRHASMRWMENHFDKRVDPRLLVDDARSVVSVLVSYYQPEAPAADDFDPGPDTIGKISRYAWGNDYHGILKEKLFLLFEWIREQVGDVGGRAFVDSAPVMDKAWAARAGLGWVGKSTMLLNRNLGTFFFVGELIIDLELPPDGPIPDYCGSCTQCLDACPTGALDEPYQIDSNRCISYLTIEHRGDELPSQYKGEIGNWIFGCDICQDVCPWNKFAKTTRDNRFRPRPGVVETPLRDWEELDLGVYRELFRRSAVKRTKFAGLKRNVAAALDKGTG